MTQFNYPGVSEELARQDALAFQTPRDVFSQFLTYLPPNLRSSLWDRADPYSALWQLGGVPVRGEDALGVSPYAEDFMQYLLNVPTGYAPGAPQGFDGYTAGMTRDEMVRRATQARDIATMGGPDFKAFYEGAPDEARLIAAQRARRFYGTGDEAAENQLNLATALALARPGGGMYAGPTGQAIRSALNEIYTTRRREGATPGTFLDWYLRNTHGVDAYAPPGTVSTVGNVGSDIDAANAAALSANVVPPDPYSGTANRVVTADRTAAEIARNIANNQTRNFQTQWQPYMGGDINPNAINPNPWDLREMNEGWV